MVDPYRAKPDMTRYISFWGSYPKDLLNKSLLTANKGYLVPTLTRTPKALKSVKELMMNLFYTLASAVE